MKHSVWKYAVLLLLFSASAPAQMTYLGLKDEANVRKAQKTLTPSFTYWNKTKIIDDYLYVPTRKGIYRKNLKTTLNDTLWQQYALPNVPVRDFVKNGNNVLAITHTEGTGNLIVKSTNNGQTFTDATSSFFFNNTSVNGILQIAQNPKDANTVAVLHRGYGIAQSADFGSSWKNLYPFLGGYQDWFVGFNPNDSGNIMYTGEELFFRSYVQATYDGGTTWQRVDSLQTHCTHGITFHPTDKNVMLSYGEGRIGRSTDQGRTWTDFNFFPIYVFKVVYDPANPDTVYASGDFPGTSDDILIYKSVDGGKTWYLSYQQVIKDSDGVLDLQLYKDRLIVYTLVNGVYFIDTALLDVKDPQVAAKTTVYPNPATDVLYIESPYTLNRVSVYDHTGKRVLQQPLNSKKAAVSLEQLAAGIYHVVLDTEKGSASKKIIKK